MTFSFCENVCFVLHSNLLIVFSNVTTNIPHDVRLTRAVETFWTAAVILIIICRKHSAPEVYRHRLINAVTQLAHEDRLLLFVLSNHKRHL